MGLGPPLGLRWLCPLLEETSHDALYLAPHPFRDPEYGHKIFGDGCQYGLQEYQTTTTGEKPSLLAPKAGLDLRHYRLPVASAESSLRQRKPEVIEGKRGDGCG